MKIVVVSAFDSIRKYPDKEIILGFGSMENLNNAIANAEKVFSVDGKMMYDIVLNNGEHAYVPIEKFELYISEVEFLPTGTILEKVCISD